MYYISCSLSSVTSKCNIKINYFKYHIKPETKRENVYNLRLNTCTFKIQNFALTILITENEKQSDDIENVCYVKREGCGQQCKNLKD